MRNYDENTVASLAPTVDGATMAKVATERNGGISLSFGREYFPRRGEITAEERSVHNYRMNKCHCATYEAMVEAYGADRVTFSEGFVGRDGWVPMKKVYVNAAARTSARTQPAAQANPVDALAEAYVVAGGDIAVAVAATKDLPGGLAVGWYKREIARLQTVAVADTVEADLSENEEAASL